MKHLFFLVLIFLSYDVRCAINNYDCFKLTERTIADLPVNYRSDEFLRIYSFFSANPKMTKMAGAAMQFYKQYVYENEPQKKWPKNVVLHVFEHLVPAYFFLDFKQIEKLTNKPKPIRNLNLPIHNRIADFKVDYILGSRGDISVGSSKTIHDKNAITFFDRHDQAIIWEFDDYVQKAFQLRKILLIELIDEMIEFSNKKRPWESSCQQRHCERFSPPKNHRIEVYDLKTKKKLSVLPFPLVKPYKFDRFLYSLADVDRNNIYLHDHRNNQSISLPYNTITLGQLMNPSNNFSFASRQQENQILAVFKEIFYKTQGYPELVLPVIIILFSLIYHLCN